MSVRSDKADGSWFRSRGYSFMLCSVSKPLSFGLLLFNKQRVAFLLGRNIKPVTQRAAQRCAGIRPGPRGCLSTSRRAAPGRSSASATPVVPSCPIPTTCSSAGRKPRVDSAPTMAQHCAILTVRLVGSGDCRASLGVVVESGSSRNKNLPVSAQVSICMTCGVAE